MNQWVRWLRDDRQVTWQGQEAKILRMGTTVQLADLNGERLPDVPVCDFALAVRSTHLPALDRPRSFAVEKKMTSRALKRFEKDKAMLLLLQTGLKTSDPINTVPQPALNPKFHTLAERTTTLAKMRARKPRKNGRQKKHHVNWLSERRRLERLLKRYREGGAQALIDPRYIAPRKIQTGEALLDELTTFLNDRRVKSTTTVSAKIVLFRHHCRKKGIFPNLPSDRTIRSRINLLMARREEFRGSASARISAGKRPEPAELQRLTSRAGELVLFDTTTVNVWVVDPVTRETYRPELTIALDHYTRAIVGMSVTKTTSAFGVVLCLADVLRPKTTDLVAEWTDLGEQPALQTFIGVPAGVAWFPGFHPEAVGVDNGMPFRATATSGEMARIGTSLEPQRALTPTDKAQVERVFRTIKDLFEALLLAFTGGSVHEKGEDPRAEAVWTGEEYERRMRQFIDLYNHRLHAGLRHERDPYVDLSPYVMWALSLEETGMLPDVTAAHEWIRFLPSVQATITASSLTARKLKYRSADLREIQRDGRALDGNKIRVYYDPSDLRRTYCFDGDGMLHALRWDKLTAHTPRFGETATNWIDTALLEKPPTQKQFTERLLDLLDEIDADTPAAVAVRRKSIGERIVGSQTDRLRYEDLEPIIDDRVEPDDIEQDPPAESIPVVEPAPVAEPEPVGSTLAPVTPLRPRQRLRRAESRTNGW
jgi:putative transposase